MARGIRYFWSVIFVLSFVLSSACVAPPTTTGSASKGGSTKGAAGSATTETTIPPLVTYETMYGATPVKIAAPTATTAPPEEWVEIYFAKRPYGYNSTAFSFDLKNPPMLINMTFKPINVTGTKVVENKYGSGELTVNYDYYSPYAWFEVTVRNKNTGEIIEQGGFGGYGKPYSQALNQTMKIRRSGLLLIELNGNQITSGINVSVKKEGNFNGTTLP